MVRIILLIKKEEDIEFYAFCVNFLKNASWGSRGPYLTDPVG